MDTVSEARLQQVCPALCNKIYLLATALESEGIVFRITQGLRTWEEQDALYQQGRTTPGPIVTNAPAGSSWHNYGLAVDVVPMDQEPPKPDWNISHPVWQRMIAVGESLDLYSGSEFCSIKDYPHFQLTGTFPVSPNNEARQTLQNSGIEAVWMEAGLVVKPVSNTVLST
jgi:peptidoglycan L-alanyl-D-glutamate endopeptidase CwlK